MGIFDPDILSDPFNLSVKHIPPVRPFSKAFSTIRTCRRLGLKAINLAPAWCTYMKGPGKVRPVVVEVWQNLESF